MANPSKTRPWVVQMAAGDQWYDTDAHRDQETAEAMAEIARKRAPGTEWRVININQQEIASPPLPYRRRTAR